LCCEGGSQWEKEVECAPYGCSEAMGVTALKREMSQRLSVRTGRVLDGAVPCYQRRAPDAHLNLGRVRNFHLEHQMEFQKRVIQGEHFRTHRNCTVLWDCVSESKNTGKGPRMPRQSSRMLDESMVNLNLKRLNTIDNQSGGIIGTGYPGQNRHMQEGATAVLIRTL